MKAIFDKIFEFRLFHSLLRISIGYRLLVLILLPAVPIFWNTYVAFQDNIETYLRIERRLEGVHYIRFLDTMVRYTQLHREYTTIQKLKAADPIQARIRTTRDSLLGQMENIDSLHSETADMFQTETLWKETSGKLKEILAKPPAGSHENYQAHNNVIMQLKRLIKTVTIRAGVFLDSSGSTYYLLLIGLDYLPDLADYTGRIGYASTYPGSGYDSPDSYQSRIQFISEKLQESMNSLSGLGQISPELKDYFVSSLNKNQELMTTYLGDVRNIGPGESDRVDADVYLSSISVVSKIYELESFAIDNAQIILAEQKSDITTKLTILVTLSTGIGIIAFVVAMMIALSINRPIQSAIELTEAMSTGNFTKKAKIHGDDEMAHFLSTINAMSTNLSQMIIGIYDTARQTADSAVELSNASEEFSSTADNQAKAVQQASSSTAQISGSTDEISDSLKRSASSMEEINHNLKHLSSIADDVKTTMDRLNDLATTTSEKASGSGTQINNATLAMQKIQESTNKITEFTSIITGISDQTNLLSLNASIEAARAGEAGRGFAVVAEEISKLADQTINSVKEVKALIDETLVSVGNGTEQVNLVAGNLKEIIDDIKSIGSYTTQIMDMLQKQADNTRSIADSSDSLNKVFSEIINSVNEQKRAATDIEKTMSNLSDGASSVSDNARQLAKLATSLKGWSEYMLKMVDVFQI